MRCEGNAEPNIKLAATACEQCDDGERVLSLDESPDGKCTPCGANMKVFSNACLCDTQFYLDESTGMYIGGWMGGWMDGWVDGWMGGWMDGWVGGWVDG